MCHLFTNSKLNWENLKRGNSVSSWSLAWELNTSLHQQYFNQERQPFPFAPHGYIWRKMCLVYQQKTMVIITKWETSANVRKKDFIYSRCIVYGGIWKLSSIMKYCKMEEPSLGCLLPATWTGKGSIISKVSFFGKQKKMFFCMKVHGHTQQNN